jgi:hypothetical protein
MASFVMAKRARSDLIKRYEESVRDAADNLRARHVPIPFRPMQVNGQLNVPKVTKGGALSESEIRAIKAKKIKNIEENDAYAKAYVSQAPGASENGSSGMDDSSKLDFTNLVTQLQDNLATGNVSQLSYNDLKKVASYVVKNAVTLDGTDWEDLIQVAQDLSTQVDKFEAAPGQPRKIRQILISMLSLLSRIEAFSIRMQQLEGATPEQRKMAASNLAKELKFTGRITAKVTDVLNPREAERIKRRRDALIQEIAPPIPAPGAAPIAIPIPGPAPRLPTSRADLDQFFRTKAQLVELGSRLNPAYIPRVGTTIANIRKRIIYLLRL